MGFDTTLDTVENARFTYIYSPLISRMLKDHKLIFKDYELTSIIMVFHKFVLANGPRAKFMTKLQLANMLGFIFELDDMEIVSVIVDRICHSESSPYPDYTPEKYCNVESFLHLFKVYFSRDLQLKMEFAFSVYDRGDKGQLNSEEVGHFVSKYFDNVDEEEAQELRLDMKVLIMQKFDLDKDTFIQAEEYYDVVTRQPRLLEFLGQIYPSNPKMEVIAVCSNILSWFDDSPNPRIISKTESN
ncbi:calaxin [Drosophila bipectinata]|uniref:calaxin n=1 Tax=Drosophila bipectinata TaxID=42026 RepID=UPI0007E8572A|nr:uncharacterized protein LOC108133172 [Drosophila bipectinata]